MENKECVIKVEKLTKTYKIFNKPIDRIKEVLNPFRTKYSTEYHALKDITFSINKGEIIGVIGSNGAGKSTLLKILTGVLTPTSGNVEIKGKVAALLELGAGFNPELTGIENIYLNGAIMDYTTEEIDNKLEEIIHFADIGDFINQPVKMYSSGMFARLAFAVNSIISPDILIVDEALAVGDMHFQIKCMEKMKKMMSNGTTILFVSHDINAVRRFCTQCLWLNHGTAMMMYDSRHKSRLFADVAAGILAGKGIRAYLYAACMPTPCLSYAVRKLHCEVGLMITASHNPREYNGYKVYGSDGCQITPTVADTILTYMDALDYFDQSPFVSLDEGLASGQIQYIDQAVIDDFEAEVLGTSQLYGDEADKAISIVYSPLHGTGAIPVPSVLEKAGFAKVTAVTSQMTFDGDFPTCPKPNPEEPEALQEALSVAQQVTADIVLATDPDCDRLGVAVRTADGTYQRLTGNEVGILLLEYICSQRKKHQAFPKEPVIVRTVVTTDWADAIAKRYGVSVITVLTGFKYIGEQIGLLEAQHKADDYVFGFEESCGYLSGAYVRDKDGVNASFLVAEMAAYYKAQGISLTTQLQKLYDRDGIRRQSLQSYTFEGSDGKERMKLIMSKFRNRQLSTIKVVDSVDYIKGFQGLPPTDMLVCIVDEYSSFVLRPSGTEPKLKSYIFVNGSTREEAEQKDQALVEALQAEIIGSI